jgi:hypothetical protein
MKRAAVILALIALGGVLLWSIGRLFALRFERGDIYPEYSTLRTDPLGAKALADALDIMPGIEVRRNYRPLIRLKPERPITLVYLGLDYQSRWDNAELVEFERIVDQGSRAVFAFKREFHRRAKPAPPTPAPGATPMPAPATPIPTPAVKFPWQDQNGMTFIEVATRWGLKFETAENADRNPPPAVAEPASGEFVETIPWHSALQFSVSQPWKVLYAVNENPVIIERQFGKGSIVLCSDSFFLSNEGLSGDPPSRLLAALFTPTSTVVFDEEHLGVTETLNVAMLARRMRFEGVVIGLVVIAALFIWKQSTSLLPRLESSSSDHDVTGTDANEGFINLLHRSIPPGNLLDA